MCTFTLELTNVIKMETKNTLEKAPVTHPDIETFYKAFSVFRSVNNYGEALVYTNQTYRIEDSFKEAQKIIADRDLNLEVSYSSFFKTITVKVK